MSLAENDTGIFSIKLSTRKQMKMLYKCFGYSLNTTFIKASPYHWIENFQWSLNKPHAFSTKYFLGLIYSLDKEHLTSSCKKHYILHSSVPLGSLELLTCNIQMTRRQSSRVFFVLFFFLSFFGYTCQHLKCYTCHFVWHYN